MKVFLTGATGFIGSAVAETLLQAGHHITALSRRETSALRHPQIGLLPGDLRRPSEWSDIARASDVIIHTAIEGGPDRLDVDRVFVEAVAGPNVVYTSVMFVLGNIDGGAEASAATGQRADHERHVLEAGGAVVRPGMVWGEGSWLFANPIVPGDGRQRWPLVHRDDLAALYLLVAEQHAKGIFHGVTEVLRASQVFPHVEPKSVEASRLELGTFADSLLLDQNVTAPRSFALGWRPTRRWQ